MSDEYYQSNAINLSAQPEHGQYQAIATSPAIAESYIVRSLPT